MVYRKKYDGLYETTNSNAWLYRPLRKTESWVKHLTYLYARGQEIYTPPRLWVKTTLYTIDMTTTEEVKEVLKNSEKIRGWRRYYKMYSAVL